MWMIDSSVYIDWMRAGRNPTRIVRPLVEAGQLVSCGLIRVEVLRGIVKPKVHDEMKALLDALREIPVTTSVWSRISELAWQLDRNGEVLPVSDLIIGCCALLSQAALITTDAHFTKIPGLTLRATVPTWR